MGTCDCAITLVCCTCLVWEKNRNQVREVCLPAFFSSFFSSYLSDKAVRIGDCGCSCSVSTIRIKFLRLLLIFIDRMTVASAAG